MDWQLDPDSGQWYDADAGADQEASWLPPGASPFPPLDMGYQSQLPIPPNSGLSLMEPLPIENGFTVTNTTGQPGTYGAPTWTQPSFLGPTEPGPLGTGTLGTMTETQARTHELEVLRRNDQVAQAAQQAAATKQYNDIRLRQYQQEIDDRKARGQEPTIQEKAQLAALANAAAASERANALAQRELEANTAYRNAQLGQQASQFGGTLAEQQAARAQSAAQFAQTFAYQQKKDRMALGQQFLSTMIQEIGRMPSADLMRAFFQMLSADTPSGMERPPAESRGAGMVAGPPAGALAPPPGVTAGALSPPPGAVGAPPLVDSSGRTAQPGEQLYPDRFGNMVWALHPMGYGAPGRTVPPAPVVVAAPSTMPVRGPAPVRAPAPVAAPAPAAAPSPVVNPYQGLTNANYVRNPLTGFLGRR